MKKGDKPQASPTEYAMSSDWFNKAGKNGVVELKFKVFRDVGSGTARIQVSIPNAHRLVFPDDLGVLLQGFGWGMAGIGCGDLMTVPSMDAWTACCRVIGEVEYCLRLE